MAFAAVFQFSINGKPQGQPLQSASATARVSALGGEADSPQGGTTED